ncbi:AraC family transcriptional regulator [Dactylosporangium vinaceum]|uniref:Helix-turn-helix domain-containing protein n=1 Tax=Dactylosporangium vinaceum TaxID=53362 RepID=A0ABV5MFS0_9ACTN|nr:AraC family transcriptional regulator [Dactylosporangium vinaceum]UAB98815.1 AraC family transcriptional regulator [Dactylosporangium vinaceum]
MAAELVTAWRPRVPGVAEVFHAHFVDHAYPLHVHDAWTLLIVDDGAIRFDLDRHHRGAAGAASVTILPPNVPHDGRAATRHGFRKRVVYLDTAVLPATLAGAAVDSPGFDDALLRLRIHQLHEALDRPGDELEAESRLALIRSRLQRHLDRHFHEPAAPRHLAAALRELLDERSATGLTLQEAGTLLGSHPGHLVRAFTASFGLPPHRYLLSRRIERARRLLLAGWRAADVAAEVGFHDQAHLHRHFKRFVGVTPGNYAA